MKKLLLALALITPLAHAEKWLELINDAGGKMQLLQSSCDESSKGRLILTSLKSGETIRGCWWYFAGQIHAVYSDGTTYAYNPSLFTLKEEK